MKVLTLKQEPRKKPVKVLDYKTGTENRTESEKLVSPRYKCSVVYLGGLGLVTPGIFLGPA